MRYVDIINFNCEGEVNKMLNEIQKSMIKYHIKKCLGAIFETFTRRNDDNPYEKLLSYVNRSRTSPISEVEFFDKKVENLTYLSKKNPFKRLEIELRGIFNPNFEILEQLGIINNIRDPSDKISKEIFQSLVEEVSLYANQYAIDLVSDYSPLKARSLSPGH